MSKAYIEVDRRVGDAMASIKRVYGYETARLVRLDALRVMSISGATIDKMKPEYRKTVLDYEAGKLAEDAAS